MEKDFTQQEILVLTGSSFFQQQCLQKNEQEKDRKQLSQRELLEEACWNGLLNELLPGIMEKSAEGKSLYLWQVTQGSSFLAIDLSEVPGTADHANSVNPYQFIHTIHLN